MNASQCARIGRYLGLSLGLALAVLPGCRRGATGSDGADPVRIAAAASLSMVFRELGSAFEREHGFPTAVEYGSSRRLAEQIRQAKPFDAFYAVDGAFVDQMIAAGACDGATRRVYAQGHLVVWTRAPESVVPLVDLASLRAPAFQRIAIADPGNSTYGRASRESLQHAGLWDALASRLVLGGDSAWPFHEVEDGRADAALVAMSLVLYQGGRFVSVDGSLHAPLMHVAVQCKHGKNPEGARAFARFLASEQGAAILRRHGYDLPAP